ncbi:transcriptional regulator family: Fungal Specific TF [Trichoderma aggressivum f. europaeum]|uniref:Transcriptional regulator family: Fungal Specific TF n=1 Tax=Trichoderma aggressivum f. europaeum TaxID=173218 RepID=A0AAE1JF27_9HYPO|nr:transcriptional regulator family: Fungal Specific TF [Trichoderma aggressivum f. europaeum]
MSTILIHTAKEFKQRRSHEKSRKGCIRCKQQRKKCDEARPICSRCQKRNHCCRYTTQNERFPPGSTPLSPEEDSPIPDIPDLDFLHLAEASPTSSEANSDGTCSGDSGIARTLQYDTLGVPQVLQPSHALNSEDLELLSHYITHTSRAIPFNAEELHALHVGMPNLAFGSRPVMGSVLALSAVCKCYDILKRSSAALDRIDDMKRLLFLADEHHRSSLHQMQGALYGGHFDTVLANAALMVLYSLSGHCVRVLLTKKAARCGITLSNEMLPLQSQWITSIRAAYVAYVGLLNSGNSELENDLPSPHSVASEDAAFHTTTMLGDNLLNPEDGPSEGTKKLLLPIVSATYGAAMEKLTAHVQAVWIGQYDSNFHAPSNPDSGLQACLTAVELLDSLFNTVFASDESIPESFQPIPTASNAHLGKLENASPWLRRYIAHVISVAPTKMLRRTIMTFLSRVPLEFLQLVQSALDYMPVPGQQNDSVCSHNVVPLGQAQQLAMNIFAHWLVLAMLLDGVWWIGTIGEWELGRILSFMETQGWMTESIETGEAWWPESMYAVQKAIAEPIE